MAEESSIVSIRNTELGVSKIRPNIYSKESKHAAVFKTCNPKRLLEYLIQTHSIYTILEA